MPEKDKIKNERKAIFFDLGCGVTSSVLALTGIIYGINTFRVITNIGWFVLSVSFWVIYFLFSVIMISYGIYSNHQSKNFDPSKYKKKIKAPFVS